MKNTKMMVFAVAMTMCLAATVMAQPPGGQRGGERGGPGGERGGPGGQRGGERGQRGGGDMGRMMQMMPVLAALDADKDGVISKSEINNAAAALRKLDKNGDGELDAEEMRPTRSEGGRSRGGAPDGGPGGERGGRSGGAGGMMDRIMSQDKNQDGKLSKDEVDERMLPMFDRLDANSDGSIDKSEIEAAAARMGGSRGGRGGPGGPGGNQGGGQRPQRPSFDGGN
ncbi:MAG: EF-hand domain-containing protein [Mariniblastus sp.]